MAIGIKQPLLFCITVCLFACTVKPAKKYSSRQQQITAYIRKYQTLYSRAADSASKMAVLDRMWNKHIRFIQDTLRFTFYPVYTVDTFYFEKIYVKRDTLVDGLHIDVLLQSELYDVSGGYFIPRDQKAEYYPGYQMLKNLNTDEPVYAVIYIQELSLNRDLVQNGTIRPIFTGSVDKIFNPD